MRAAMQEREVHEKFDRFRMDESDKSFVLVIDFKMNFQSSFRLESRLECYGKRGMSWHGVVIFHNKDNQRTLEGVADVKGNYLKTSFVDHINGRDAKKMWMQLQVFLKGSS